MDSPSIILIFYLYCGFASLLAYIDNIFGTKQLGTIHGCTLKAWSAPGLADPMFAAWIKDTTGSYAASLHFFSVLFILALIISILTQLDIKKIKKSRRRN